MASPCAFLLPGGAKCLAKKSAPIHLRITPGHHDYEDASKAGLKAVSDGRAAYQRSAAHTEAYAAAKTPQCLAKLADAPGTCVLPLTPHHTVPRSKAGGLEAADTYPIITLCAFHNSWVQEDGRDWATTHFVTVGNRQWPFLVTDEFLQAERNGVRL